MQDNCTLHIPNVRPLIKPRSLVGSLRALVLILSHQNKFCQFSLDSTWRDQTPIYQEGLEVMHLQILILQRRSKM